MPENSTICYNLSLFNYFFNRAVDSCKNWNYKPMSGLSWDMLCDTQFYYFIFGTFYMFKLYFAVTCAGGLYSFTGLCITNSVAFISAENLNKKSQYMYYSGSIPRKIVSGLLSQIRFYFFAFVWKNNKHTCIFTNYRINNITRIHSLDTLH